jgi:hypothetical protein
MKRMASRLAAVTVVASLMLGAPAAATPAPIPIPPNVGVHSHLLWQEYDNPTRLRLLDKLAELKIGWIRLDIGWATLEETGRGKIGQWYVNRLDWVLKEAAARDIKVLGMLWTTPKWANGGKDWNVPPTNVGEYARAAKWLAQRFKGRVAAWELWNEASDEYFWDGDVESYAALVRATYPAIKAADPKATVVVGGTVYNDDKWLAQAYDAGIGGHFDALSTHPYMGPSDAPPEQIDNGTIWRIDHVRAVRQLMVARGDGDKPIWFTEFGWSSHDNEAGTPPWEMGVTETVQAEYLVRGMTHVARNYPYVTHIFWYVDRDTTTDDLQDDNRGLLRVDMSTKPAYDAMKGLLDPDSAPTTTTSTIAAGHVTEGPSSGGGPWSWWLLLGAAMPVILILAAQVSRRWRRGPFPYGG